MFDLEYIEIDELLYPKIERGMKNIDNDYHLFSEAEKTLISTLVNGNFMKIIASYVAFFTNYAFL